MANSHPARADLTILPLGGLGKIGMNAMLVGHGERFVLVDCGVGFAAPTVLGAEKMLPDLGLLSFYRDKIEAVLITHGHEDHIGALPWVLPQLDPATPVFAAPFTSALIRNRLEEHGGWAQQRMRRFSPGTRFECGPFAVDAIRVTHSLPECASVVLRCEGGTLLHTGDWKIDDEPLDGEHFDRAAFERLAQDGGVDVMLSDSTNIMAPGRTRSEAEVVREIEKHVEAWPGRVVMTMFASNLHRLRGIGALARATGRKLVVAGRSIKKYLEASDALPRVAGMPPIPRDVVDIEEARHMDPRQQLVLTTGSQGEPFAALARAANGEHDHLSLSSEDLVLHSARIIPGNEGDVHSMWNALAHRGVALVTDRKIHASGHAQTDELKELLQIVRPRCFVPVHGETVFLKAHAALGTSLGFASVAIENGERLDFAGPAIASPTRSQVELVEYWNDGPATGDEDAMRLKERRRLAWNGLVVLDAHVSRAADQRAEVKSLAVETRALWLGPDEGLRRELVDVAKKVIVGCPPGTPWSEMEEALRASLRAAAKRLTEKRPDVIVVLHAGRAA